MYLAGNPGTWLLEGLPDRGGVVMPAKAGIEKIDHMAAGCHGLADR
jgi:hypothetical protein